VKIKCTSFYKGDFSDADIVFMYMTRVQAARIRPRLERQLHPGARVITISCEIEGWKPVNIDREELIYVYRAGSTSDSHLTR
jgi:hypothetical protein